MITCKEDLYGTHVFYRDTEAMKEYIRLIRVLGVGDVSDNQPSERECIVEVHKCDWTSSGYDASWTDIAGIDNGSKRLTLSNFKPTRTEYVQVTESIFDLRDELEHGELYERHVESIKATSLSEGSGVTYGYSQIKSELDLFKLAANGDVIYRRVERVIDERQEFIDAACKALVENENCRSANVNIDCSYAMRTAIDAIADSGKFKLVRANGEIE